MSSPNILLILDCDSIPDNSLSRLHHRSTSLSDLHEEENFDTLLSECKKRCEKNIDKNFKHAAFELLSKALRKNVTGWHFTTFQDQLKKVLSLYEGEELPAIASNEFLDQFFSLNLRVNPEPYFKEENEFLNFWEFFGRSVFPKESKIWNLLAIHYCNYLYSCRTFECSIEHLLKYLNIYIRRSTELNKSEEFRIVYLRLYVFFYDLDPNNKELLILVQRIGGLDLNWISELLLTMEIAERNEACLDDLMGKLLLKLFQEYTFDQIPQHHFENILKNISKFIKRNQSRAWLAEHKNLLKKLFNTSFCLHNMLEYRFQWKEKEKIDDIERFAFYMQLFDPVVEDAEEISELFPDNESLMANLRIELIRAVINEMNRLHKFESKTSSPRELRSSTSPRGNPMARMVAMTNLTPIKKYLEILGLSLALQLPKEGGYLEKVMQIASQYECLKPLLEKLGSKETRP